MHQENTIGSKHKLSESNQPLQDPFLSKSKLLQQSHDQFQYSIDYQPNHYSQDPEFWKKSPNCKSKSKMKSSVMQQQQNPYDGMSYDMIMNQTGQSSFVNFIPQMPKFGGQQTNSIFNQQYHPVRESTRITDTEETKQETSNSTQPQLNITNPDQSYPTQAIKEESKHSEDENQTHQIMTDSCRKMVENILSLEIFKTYQNLINVRSLKTITNALDGNYMAYLTAWTSLLNYEIYNKISENSPDIPDVFRELEQGIQLHFSLDKSTKLLVPTIPSRLKIPLEQNQVQIKKQYDNLKTLVRHDLVLLTLQEINLREDTEILPQLKDYLKTNIFTQSKFCLAMVSELNENQIPLFEVSHTQLQFLNTLQGRGETVDLHCYFITSLCKEIKILSTLDKIENNPIFSQILNPRKTRQRINFNPTDKFLGKMEIWIQEAEKKQKITPSESELILKYSPFYKEKLVIINGMPGSGKTFTALSIASMRLQACQSSQSILYLVPNRESMLNILYILENGMIHNGQTSTYSKLVYSEIIMQNMLMTEQFSTTATNLNEKYIQNVFNHVKAHYQQISQAFDLIQPTRRNNIHGEETEQALDLKIMKEIIRGSNFILATYEFITMGEQSLIELLHSIGSIILDDAHSMMELDSLILVGLAPSQIALVGSEELPRQLCYSDNSSTTHLNKSLFTRMIEQDINFIKLKSQIRIPNILLQVLQKIFYKDQHIFQSRLQNSQPMDVQAMSRFMRRILVFDLIYLKELKQQSFKSDFDELQFTINLILDLTRAIAEQEGIHAHSDDLKMQHSFSKIKNCIGIVVPFERCIGSFRVLFEPMKAKIGATDDDIFIGTADMFRGVEKEIIIVTNLRNSVVDGLGLLEQNDMIQLVMTRARSFFWVVGCSPLYQHIQHWKEFLHAAKMLSIGRMNNYYIFEHHKEWLHGRLLTLIRSFIKRDRDQSPMKGDHQSRSKSKSKFQSGNNNNYGGRGGGPGQFQRNQIRGMAYKDQLELILQKTSHNQKRNQRQIESSRDREREQRENRKMKEVDWNDVNDERRNGNQNNQKQNNEFW